MDKESPVDLQPAEQPIRSTGRIKKPKIVFDPSDEYIVGVAKNQTGKENFGGSGVIKKDTSKPIKDAVVVDAVKRTKTQPSLLQHHESEHKPIKIIEKFADAAEKTPKKIEPKTVHPKIKEIKLFKAGNEKKETVTSVQLKKHDHITYDSEKAAEKLKASPNITETVLPEKRKQIQSSNGLELGNAKKVKVMTSIGKSVDGNKTITNIPLNLKNWSAAQVASYFENIFPGEGKVFNDEKIDGSAILLLQRADIITKLPVKLGPLVLIADHIATIQEHNKTQVAK